MKSINRILSFVICAGMIIAGLNSAAIADALEQTPELAESGSAQEAELSGEQELSFEVDGNGEPESLDSLPPQDNPDGPDTAADEDSSAETAPDSNEEPSPDEEPSTDEESSPDETGQEQGVDQPVYEVPDPADIEAVMNFQYPMMLSGIDQGLVAEFVGVGGVNLTGAYGRMRLYTSLSSTDNGEYATVQIPIPDIAGISFPQFNASGIYTIYTDFGENIELRLISEAGKPKWIEYKIHVGDTIIALINVVIPNGWTPHNTTVTFPTPVVKASESNFTGQSSLIGGSLTFEAYFGWSNVRMTTNPQNTSVAISGSTLYLKDDVTYAITSENLYNGRTSGVIFTQNYTLSGTITLPAGISFPAGAVSLSGDSKSVMIGGVTVATFSKALQSANISGGVLTYAYFASNATLDSSGNQAAGKTAADLSNLDITVKLFAGKLVLADANVNAKQITHAVNFTAVACKTAATHNSSANGVTTITVTGAAFKFTKANSPSLSTKIFNTTTPIVYTVTVKNESITRQTVTVSDSFPAGTDYVAGSATAVTTPETLSVTASGLEWQNIVLEPGESRVFSFSVTVKSAVASGTTISNTAKLTYGSGSTQMSNTVSNLFDTTDDLSLVKRQTGNPTVTHYAVVPYTITVQNLSAFRQSGVYDVVDTMPAGLEMTEAQVDALKQTFPGALYNAATRVLTIPGITLSAGGSVNISYNATVTKEFEDNDAIVNTAEIKALNLKSTATVRYRQKRAVMSIAKTHGNLEKVAPDRYEIEFKITALNKGDISDNLKDPPQFVDTMTGGLRPVGAGTAAGGSIAGVDNKGNAVTGTWARTGSSAPYTYTITWPPIPVLQTNESYSISYKGEVAVTLDQNGVFAQVDATNNVKIIGSVEDRPGSGVHPGGGGSSGGGVVIPIRPECFLTKKITDINGISCNLKSSELFAGDKISYTITVANQSASAISGTLTDILPSVKFGSSFTWVYGTNVTVAGPTPIGPSVVNNRLTWDVSIPASSVLSFTVTLAYPTGNTFDSAFGTPPSAVVNTATFVAAGISLRDSASHSITEMQIEFSKTVDNPIVDSSEPLAQNRRATFTIQGFDTMHVAESFSLMDDLADVRNKFDITSIDYGSYSIVGTNGAAKGYSIILTFTDATTQTFNVSAGNTTYTPSLTGGKTIAQIATIKWDFGDVRTLTVKRAPSVTATAKVNAGGKVKNRAFLAYNIASYDMVEASVTLTSSGTLKKAIYDSFGSPITNGTGTNPVKIGDTVLFEISFTNTTGSAVNLANAHFTDNIRVGGLDTTKPLQLTITHIPLIGTAPNPVTPAKMTIPAADWADGEFDIPLTGVMQDGDVLMIQYSAVTGTGFKDSVNGADQTIKDAAKLYNKISLVIDGYTDTYDAETDAYDMVQKLFLDMKTSIVGTAYGMGYNNHSGGNGGLLYITLYNSAWASQYAAGWIGNNNFQLKGVPYQGDNPTIDRYGLNNVIIYDTTIINTAESTQNLYWSGGTNTNYLRITPPKGGRVAGLVLRRFDAANPGMVGTSLSNGYLDGWMSSNSASPYCAGPYSASHSGTLYYGDTELKQIYSGITVSTCNGVDVPKTGATFDIKLSSGATIKPGEALTVRYYVVMNEYCNASDAYPSGETYLSQRNQAGNTEYADLTATLNTSYFRLNNSSGTTLASALSPSSADANKLQIVDIDLKGIQTYDNATPPPIGFDSFDYATISSPGTTPVNMGTTSHNRSTSTSSNYIRSDVSIKMPEQKVSISKVASAFYENWISYSSKGTKHVMDGSDGVPGLKDAIEWTVTLKNEGNTNLSYFNVLDQTPFPYGMDASSKPGGGGNDRIVHAEVSHSAYPTRWAWFEGIAGTTFLTSFATKPSPTDYSIGYSTNESPGGQGYMDLYRPSHTVFLPNGNDPYAFSKVYITPYGAGRGTGTSFIPGVLRPGDTMTIKYYMAPYALYTAREAVDYRSYDNTAYIIAPAQNVTVGTKGEPVYYDHTGTGEIAGYKLTGAKASDTVFIGGQFASMSEKTVENEEHEIGYGKGVNTVSVNPGSTFRYSLDVQSKSNVKFEDMVLIDRLPQVGDSGAVNTQSKRGSEFKVDFAQNPNVGVDIRLYGETDWTPLASNYFTVDYKLSGPTATYPTADWDGSNTTGWSSSSTGMDTLRVRMINGYHLPARATLRLTFNGTVSDSESLNAGQIAWNSFGYRYKVFDDVAQTNRIIVAEPAKVGVKISGAKISINKKVSPSGEALSGAVFGVFKDAACAQPVKITVNGTPANVTMTTDSQGVAVSTPLRKGIYYVREITPPATYLLSSTVYTVDLTNAADGATVKANTTDIVNSRTPVTLTLTKSFAPGTPLSLNNIVIRVTGVFSGNNNVQTRSATFTPAQCDGAFTQEITGLIVGNEYTITENNAVYSFTATCQNSNASINGNRFSLIDDARIDIENSIAQAGSLKIKKVVDGADGGESFIIEVSGVFNNPANSPSTQYITIDPARRGEEIEIPGVLYGQIYTIYESYGANNYRVAYSAEAVTMSASDILVTVTNTPLVIAPGELVINKTVSGAVPTTDIGGFTVRVAGSFSDTAATYKDIVLTYPDYREKVEGVKLGQTYSVTEINVPGIYGAPAYTGIDGNGNTTITSIDKTVTVNNTPKTKAALQLTKIIEANTLNTARTFKFQLTGPSGAGSQVIEGIVATSGTGAVLWNGDPTLELDPGNYTLEEILPTGAAADYKFKDFAVSVNGGTAFVTQTNTLNLTIAAGTSVNVTCTNEVAKGSLRVGKEIFDVNGDPRLSAAQESFWIGLYDETGSTLLDKKELIWNEISHTYHDAAFSDIPYGIYTVYELLEVGGSYLRASSPLTDCPYTVTGDGVRVALQASNQGETLATVQNHERYSTLNLQVNKAFASNADLEVLEDQVFTVKLVRKDGEAVTPTAQELIFTLQKSTWQDTVSNLRLAPGEYELYELHSLDGAWITTGIEGGGDIDVTGAQSSGTWKASFTVDYNDLGGTKNVYVTVTNKATSKKLNSFTLGKAVDNLDGLSAGDRTFTFNLFNDDTGIPIATGTLIKTTTSSQQVVSWTAAGGGVWDPDEYLWTIGGTYRIEEEIASHFALDSVTGGAEYLEAGEFLAGVTFTVDEDVNSVSFTFTNKRKEISSITITKVVQAEDGAAVPVSEWAAGSRFIFGIYEEDNGENILIGTMQLDESSPTKPLETSKPILMGKTYYVKEMAASPSSRYEFADFSGTGLMPVSDGLYSFTAENGLAITAKNILMPASLKLEIVKNLIDDNLNAAPATEQETFVFEITDGTNAFYHIVTIPAGSSSASIVVSQLLPGVYTVKELNGNWRYTLVSANNITKLLSNPDEVPVFEFSNQKTNDKWVSDKTKVTNEMPPLS